MNKSGTQILRGQWSANTSWEFYLSRVVPEAKLCTAVYCLAITKSDEKIVLTRIERGWEMLGGHIEPGESLLHALAREALEEGGFVIQKQELYGFLKVTSKKPVVNDHHGGFYPLTSYIPYFLAHSDLPLAKPHGIEVLDSKAFLFEEIAALGISQEAILNAGLNFYKNKLMGSRS